MTDRGQNGADELDGFKDGHDQEHWFQADPELTTQDIAFSIENDAVLVRLALENFPASILVISISARSVLIFTLKDDASNHCEGINRDLLCVIWLPCSTSTIFPVRIASTENVTEVLSVAYPSR
jgi:hypothetical protein